jgi:BirA family biotin operon repressor/biotin-[acetyl-CoA-carboxylase] ligase
MPAAPILLLDETDSTNADARRRAEAGETGPAVDRRATPDGGARTAGDASWESEGGNLFSTLLTIDPQSRRPRRRR